MGLFKQESAYERRKRELDEEAERVRKNLQALMKSVKKEAHHSVLSGLPSFNESGLESGAETSVLLDEPGDCIVTLDDEQENTDFSEPVSSEQEQSSADQLPPYGTARLRHFQSRQKENLPNYLATGSFGKRGPLTREKRIQRNKAVFMAILAVLAVFSLISWLK